MYSVKHFQVNSAAVTSTFLSLAGSMNQRPASTGVLINRNVPRTVPSPRLMWSYFSSPCNPRSSALYSCRAQLLKGDGTVLPSSPSEKVTGSANLTVSPFVLLGLARSDTTTNGSPSFSTTSTRSYVERISVRVAVVASLPLVATSSVDESLDSRPPLFPGTHRPLIV